MYLDVDLMTGVSSLRVRRKETVENRRWDTIPLMWVSLLGRYNIIVCPSWAGVKKVGILSLGPLGIDREVVSGPFSERAILGTGRSRNAIDPRAIDDRWRGSMILAEEQRCKMHNPRFTTDDSQSITIDDPGFTIHFPTPQVCQRCT